MKQKTKKRVMAAIAVVAILGLLVSIILPLSLALNS